MFARLFLYVCLPTTFDILHLFFTWTGCNQNDFLLIWRE